MSVKRLETGAGADQVVLPVSGAARGDRPASPLPPLFWLLAKLAELWPTEGCLPEGQGPWNRWRKSATQERRSRLHGLRAPTQEGLDGPERTRTIRQDSSQNRKNASTARAKRGPFQRLRGLRPAPWGRPQFSLSKRKISAAGHKEQVRASRAMADTPLPECDKHCWPEVRSKSCRFLLEAPLPNRLPNSAGARDPFAFRPAETGNLLLACFWQVLECPAKPHFLGNET